MSRITRFSYFPGFFLTAAAVSSCLLPTGNAARAQETPPAAPPPAESPATPPVATPPSASGSAFQRGLDAHKRGDMDAALQELEKAVADDPRNPDALSWLGFLLVQRNQPEQAIPHLEKSLALKPGVADTHTNLGNALLLKPGRTQEETLRAITLFEKAVELSPSSSEANFNLGYAYSRTAQYAQAAESYRKAIALNEKDGRAWTNLGLALQNLGKNEEAAEALRKGAALAPQDAATWVNLGMMELQRENGDKVAATNALETARKLDPGNYLVLINLGNLYVEAKRYPEAADAFGAAADIADAGNAPAGRSSAIPRYNQGFVLTQAGQTDEALAAYDKALAANPRSFDALVNSGALLYRADRTDEAIARFKTAVEVGPDTSSGKPEATVKREKSLAWANLGGAYSRKKDMANAADAWRQAAALDPRDYASRDFLASYLTGQKKYDEAIKVYKEMITLRPKSVAPMNAIGLIYQRQEKYDAAFSTFKAATLADPKSAAAHNNLGVIYEKRGQVTEAIAAYRKALAINPNLANARQNLARFQGSAASTAKP